MFIVWSVIGIASSSSSPGSANVFRASGGVGGRTSFPPLRYMPPMQALSCQSFLGEWSLCPLWAVRGHLLSGLPSFFALYGIDIQVSLQR